MNDVMRVRIWDVQHGACAMVQNVFKTVSGEQGGRLAMVDCGAGEDWRPSTYIRQALRRSRVDYLFITNADQDHMTDLNGLRDEGIEVDTLIRNMSYTGAQLRVIKEQTGPLTNAASSYASACDTYVHPTSIPFDQNMGGIQIGLFSNSYPQFWDTNNLSLAIFFKFAGFKILFPGDLEKSGWQALLLQPAFRAELANTEVLVASHHGRENGFYEPIFNYFTPSVIVISDKGIEHETQETVPDYRRVVSDTGVYVRSANKFRHVLTTRRDGWIQFDVDRDGRYIIDTEYVG
jgi:beta-lactamase superfamily II metal-dependent hydrolase